MKSKHFLTIGMLAALFGACSKNLDLPQPKSEQKIVLLGELIAGDTILMRAGQSLPLGTSSNGQLPELIKGLNITVQKDNSASITLRSEEDAQAYILSTLPFSSPDVVQPNSKYEITATHESLGTATASVQIPLAFSVNTLRNTSTISGTDTMLDVEFEIKDSSPAGHQYVIEVLSQPVSINTYFSYDGSTWPTDQYQYLYDSLVAEGVETFPYSDTSYSGMYSRKYFYCTDQSAENVGGATTGRLLRRVFLPQAAIAGGRHRTQVIVPLRSEYEFSTGHAETIIQIKSVAPDYYDYLKAYDNYIPTISGIGGTNLENLTGNVKNGLGAIGGVYRQTIRVFK